MDIETQQKPVNTMTHGEILAPFHPHGTIRLNLAEKLDHAYNPTLAIPVFLYYNFKVA